MEPLDSHRLRISLSLVGLVFGLDLAWAQLVGPTGSVTYGLADEPAHLATCAVALLLLWPLLRRGPGAPFVLAALVASVALDLDHLPLYLGSRLDFGGLPRPYTHSAVFVALVVALAHTLPARRWRWIMLGVALGFAAHLLRDLATGPGVPLLWPLSEAVVRADYALYAVALLGLVFLTATGRPATVVTRAAAAVLVALAVVVAATGVGAESAQARVVGVGGYMSEAGSGNRLLGAFGGGVGGSGPVLTYKSWGEEPFVREQLTSIWDGGGVPLVTWEPWRATGAPVGLAAIAAGAADAYVRRAARSAAVWGKPLLVRFGQEMNGSWFPWTGRPWAYRQAWRHLVLVFRAAGADNVQWVWTPYVDAHGRLPFASYFPGRRWTDWVGLDGINWGGRRPWRTFGRLFHSSYRQLVRLAPHKPVIIAETGSGERGGSKARWLAAMLRRYVPRMRHIRAVSFWSVDDRRGDLRLDSSAAAVRTVRRALRQPLYTASRAALIHAPASSAGDGARSRARAG